MLPKIARNHQESHRGAFLQRCVGPPFSAAGNLAKSAYCGKMWQIATRTCSHQHETLFFLTEIFPIPQKVQVFARYIGRCSCNRKGYENTTFSFVEAKLGRSYLARPLSGGKSSRPAPEDAVFGGTVRA